MLKPKTKRIIRLLAKKYHLKAVMLFGRRRDNCWAGSDGWVHPVFGRAVGAAVRLPVTSCRHLSL